MLICRLSACKHYQTKTKSRWNAASLSNKALKKSQNTTAKSYLTLFQLAAPKCNLKSISYSIQYFISMCLSTRTGFHLIIIEASRGHANKKVAQHLVDNAELCSIAMVSTDLLHGIPNHIRYICRGWKSHTATHCKCHIHQDSLYSTVSLTSFVMNSVLWPFTRSFFLQNFIFVQDEILSPLHKNSLQL